MNRSATCLGMMSAFLMVLAPGACSTDRSGLGELDAGSSSGGRIGVASGGAVGSGGGGAIGTGGGGAVGAGSGGATAVETGGTVGSGGLTASGGAASGGRGEAGAASGGRSGGGGTASGGASGGGRMGTGGAATGGRGTGGAASMTPKPDCTRDSDCHLYNDCCTCAAIGPNQPAPPLCAQVCIQSRCAALQLPQNAVACVAGRCVAGFDCDVSEVTCRMAAPDCPAGQVPSVNASRSCYSGACVPATQCTFVTNCNDCGPADACITNQTRGTNERHCVTIPVACNGATTCGCLGATTCVSPYTSCDTSGNGLTCGCPTC